MKRRGAGDFITRGHTLAHPHGLEPDAFSSLAHLALFLSPLLPSPPQALLHMDDDPSNGFRKLNYLLSNPPFPPETFGNLLLLHCKFQYYDLAADILAENAHLTYKFLPQVRLGRRL